MKANEAPEKIYLVIDPVWGSMSVNYNRNDTNNIEYTRTDAFIEKVCEYLQVNLWKVVNEESDFRQRFVTDFRNYMKGE